MKTSKLTNAWLCGLVVVFLLLILSTPTQAKSAAKGWLGVAIEEMTPSMRADYELGQRTGLLVTEVMRHSPADKAGLEEDDVILSYDDQPVDRADQLIDLVRATKPGTEVKIVVFRDGKEKEFPVTIAKKRRKRFRAMVWNGDNDFVIRMGGPRLGVVAQNLNEDLAGYFQVQPHEGVLVVQVLEDSPAEQAGLKAGDVILRIDDEAVADRQDLVDALKDYEEGDQVEVEFIRKGKKQKVTVELEEVEEEDIRIERFMPRHFRMPEMMFFDDDDVRVKRKVRTRTSDAEAI